MTEEQTDEKIVKIIEIKKKNDSSTKKKTTLPENNEIITQLNLTAFTKSTSSILGFASNKLLLYFDESSNEYVTVAAITNDNNLSKYRNTYVSHDSYSLLGSARNKVQLSRNHLFTTQHLRPISDITYEEGPHIKPWNSGNKIIDNETNDLLTIDSFLKFNTSTNISKIYEPFLNTIKNINNIPTNAINKKNLKYDMPIKSENVDSYIKTSSSDAFTKLCNENIYLVDRTFGHGLLMGDGKNNNSNTRLKEIGKSPLIEIFHSPSSWDSKTSQISSEILETSKTPDNIIINSILGNYSFHSALPILGVFSKLLKYGRPLNSSNQRKVYLESKNILIPYDYKAPIANDLYKELMSKTVNILNPDANILPERSVLNNNSTLWNTWEIRLKRITKLKEKSEYVDISTDIALTTSLLLRQFTKRSKSNTQIMYLSEILMRLARQSFHKEPFLLSNQAKDNREYEVLVINALRIAMIYSKLGAQINSYMLAKKAAIYAKPDTIKFSILEACKIDNNERCRENIEHNITKSMIEIHSLPFWLVNKSSDISKKFLSCSDSCNSLVCIEYLIEKIFKGDLDLSIENLNFDCNKSKVIEYHSKRIIKAQIQLELAKNHCLLQGQFLISTASTALRNSWNVLFTAVPKAFIDLVLTFIFKLHNEIGSSKEIYSAWLLQKKEIYNNDSDLTVNDKWQNLLLYLGRSWINALNNNQNLDLNINEKTPDVKTELRLQIQKLLKEIYFSNKNLSTIKQSLYNHHKFQDILKNYETQLMRKSASNESINNFSNSINELSSSVVQQDQLPVNTSNFCIASFFNRRNRMKLLKLSFKFLINIAKYLSYNKANIQYINVQGLTFIDGEQLLSEIQHMRRVLSYIISLSEPETYFGILDLLELPNYNAINYMTAEIGCRGHEKKLETIHDANYPWMSIVKESVEILIEIEELEKDI